MQQRQQQCKCMACRFCSKSVSRRYSGAADACMLSLTATAACRLPLSGFYSTEGSSGPCQACSPGFTTEGTGATSSELCSLCIAGHGGASCTACPSATYATADNPQEPCTPCASSTSFLLQFPGVSEQDFEYVAPTVTIEAAPSRAACTASYLQMSNSAPLTTAAGSMVLQQGVTSLQGCVAACSSAACQFLSFSYADSTCSLRTGTAGHKPDST